MKNITLAIDDDLLERARRRAAQKGTSVNAVVREQLARFVDQDDERAQARRELVEMAHTSKGRLGPDYKWNREDAYAERLFPRHQPDRLRGDG